MFSLDKIVHHAYGVLCMHAWACIGATSIDWSTVRIWAKSTTTIVVVPTCS